MPAEALNAANPHRNGVRNSRKKLDAVKELKKQCGGDLASLTPEQVKKVKTEKKLEKELAEFEKKYDEWEKECGGGGGAEAAPAPAAAPAKPAAKKAKKEAPAAAHADPASPPAAPAAGAGKKNGEPKKEKKKEKEWTKVESPKGSPASPPAKAPAKAGGEAAGGGGEADEKEIKTMKNRLKNLKAKLEQIAELKKKGQGELSKEQITKIKTERKTRDEIAAIDKKLAATGA